MSKKPLEMLRAGLAQLNKQVVICKNDILCHLMKKEHISEEDEHWLDHEANLFDEDVVVDLLEKASDYEHGLERLNSQQETLVEMLITDLKQPAADLIT